MRGRKKSTGRFDTREEFEAHVWAMWLETKASQTDIAIQQRVSQPTISAILAKRRPPCHR